MKRVMTFAQCVLEELGTLCCTSTSRDVKTVTARFEHEGYAFLAISLAAFGADFQKSLDQGHVSHDQFAGFSRAGGLPRFLGGFLDHVFDRASARLLAEPCVTCIHSIRQFTLMWSKMELECSEARKRQAMLGFVECEQEVATHDAQMAPELLEQFERIGAVLWADMFSEIDRKVYFHELHPKHGPGATADRLRGNAKYSVREWPHRLDKVFPAGEYLIPNWRFNLHLQRLDFLEPGQERPVRVVLVPKTLKTPRVIAIEPTAMQYMQQALLDGFTEYVGQSKTGRRRRIGDDYLDDLISSESQIPNGDMARQGSSDGTLATLDLSEASDRVSNQLVRRLMRHHPNLLSGVDACRSRRADAGEFGMIRLSKFASMGSALTFPVEMMVFMTVVFVGIESALSRRITRKDVRSLVGQVRCYGDDIVVPTAYVHEVVRALEAFGLKVNRSKSFWNGKFRESCGQDFYDGHDVSIVRIRSEFPTDLTEPEKIESTMSTRNQLYKAGLWQSARHLDVILGRIIPLPIVEESSSVIGRHSFLHWSSQEVRTCPRLHSPLVRGLHLRRTIPSSTTDGVSSLLKCLLSRSDLPFADARHLERSGRPIAVDTRIGWGQPF